MRNQCILINSLALNFSSSSSSSHIDDDNVINIQLLYDLNRPIKPKLWHGNFYPISLYKSLEHLISDAKNIKKSMACIAIYIKNKKIEAFKSNNIKDFKDISKVAWKLISSIYESKWNLLIADNHKNNFRQKVTYKFTS